MAAMNLQTTTMYFCFVTKRYSIFHSSRTNSSAFSTPFYSAGGPSTLIRLSMKAKLLLSERKKASLTQEQGEDRLLQTC